MSFTIYEIISHLVPGYIVVFFLRQELGIDLNDLGNTSILALAFACGFVVQTLASWFEDILYFTWGGKPSNQLLNGKDMWKVRFYSSNEVKNLLKEEAQRNGQTNYNNDSLFEIAQRRVNSQKSDRVTSFNANYAFVRSMVLAFLLVLVNNLFKLPSNLNLILILAALLIVSWYRAKQRGFYFAREVLNMYLVDKLKENERSGMLS